MHDFFIDRIVRLNDPDLNSLVSEVSAKVKVGGGSIRGISQEEIKGGNAVNVAYALAKLGAKISLITVADDLGKSILDNAFAPFTNKKLLIADGKQGYTVSFEVENAGKKANVMVSDAGDTKTFGSEKLHKKELHAIKHASAVVIANWASNKKGTELAVKAFKNSSKEALCFMDPADIGSRKDEFRRCLDELSSHIDVLSVNENECRLTMQSMNLSPLPINYSNKDIITAAKTLASRLSINVDLHTPLGSATSNGEETSFAKSLNVNVAISTGAGDIWDAADIAGYLCELQANERLAFANACAAFYISKIESPTLQEAARFLRSIEAL
jgi:ribokinase